ncbi:hypothetical protein DFH08DRAFT_938128 [Mycena albidolilacea]|uniref:Uncharacterized protein n=1 Tax=Mycena albidolilacea TaxID=1033008 RepID=A0AAD6ZW57_9AGAR|nr:hypothetical protein DFH08DRAFT_938128 [Mycena albidolilacea]
MATRVSREYQYRARFWGQSKQSRRCGEGIHAGAVVVQRIKGRNEVCEKQALVAQGHVARPVIRVTVHSGPDIRYAAVPIYLDVFLHRHHANLHPSLSANLLWHRGLASSSAPRAPCADKRPPPAPAPPAPGVDIRRGKDRGAASSHLKAHTGRCDGYSANPIGWRVTASSVPRARTPHSPHPVPTQTWRVSPTLQATELRPALALTRTASPRWKGRAAAGDTEHETRTREGKFACPLIYASNVSAEDNRTRCGEYPLHVRPHPTKTERKPRSQTGLAPNHKGHTPSPALERPSIQFNFGAWIEYKGGGDTDSLSSRSASSCRLANPVCRVSSSAARITCLKEEGEQTSPILAPRLREGKRADARPRGHDVELHNDKRSHWAPRAVSRRVLAFLVMLRRP